MAFPRSYHTLTVLPDGTVLASGGSSELRRRDHSQRRPAGRDLEPGTPRRGRRWRSQQRGRGCTTRPSLLLPDGRVLLAGGGQPGYPLINQKNARDLLAAVPVQGPAPGHPERAGARSTYGETFTVSDARRRAHREGRAHPHRLRDAQLRRGPALRAAERSRAAATTLTLRRAGEPERRAARLLHAVPRHATACRRSSTSGAAAARADAAAGRDRADGLVTAPAAAATSTGAVRPPRRQRCGRRVPACSSRVDGHGHRRRGHDRARTRSTWNTTTVANGPHTLTAVARDAAGNTTTSPAVDGHGRTTCPTRRRRRCRSPRRPAARRCRAPRSR